MAIQGWGGRTQGQCGEGRLPKTRCRWPAELTAVLHWVLHLGFCILFSSKQVFFPSELLYPYFILFHCISLCVLKIYELHVSYHPSRSVQSWWASGASTFVQFPSYLSGQGTLCSQVLVEAFWWWRWWWWRWWYSSQKMWQKQMNYINAWMIR